MMEELYVNVKHQHKSTIRDITKYDIYDRFNHLIRKVQGTTKINAFKMFQMT